MHQHNIKDDLKDLVENTMIPEVEAYLEDLHKLLEAKTQTPDDMLAIEEMESFLVELQNVLAVIEEELGVVKGHLETIHAYTNDQNLVDNMHDKYRRGRAAALNMVITETGAGSAVAKALPVLAGKLTSNAIRVPVPNGSLVVLSDTNCYR